MTALINPWIAGGAAAYGLVLLFGLGLCKAAARGDRMLEAEARARRSEQ